MGLVVNYDHIDEHEGSQSHVRGMDGYLIWRCNLFFFALLFMFLSCDITL